jgi:AhpC/TSA family
MRNLVLFIIAASIGLASVPVSDACGESGAVVATIQASGAVRVEHGVLGESTPCYAVTLEQNGTTIRGYVSDVTLPAIVEFERKRALESRVAIPELPPATAKDAKKASEPPPTGPPFEPWSGADIHGKRLQIGASNAKVTLLTFWSAASGAARRSAENIMSAEAEFRSKGVKVYGMAQAMNLGRLDYYMDDMGLDYPVVLDRQGLAAKYGADASKGTTLVIDASNHIIASSSDPKAIHAAVVKLLSSE